MWGSIKLKDKHIGERVKLFRLKKGLKQKDLAAILEVTPQAISGWERGVTYPQVELYSKIASALDTSKDSLFFETTGNNAEHGSRNGVFYVPFYTDIEAAAGYGFWGGDYPSVERFPLPEQIFTKQFNRSDVFCVRCCGDSMEPIIYGGSILAVNKSVNKISDGSVYLLNAHGALRVKILHVEAKGIVIKSYNPSYEDERISFEEFESLQFKIVGKVIWFSTNLLEK